MWLLLVMCLWPGLVIVQEAPILADNLPDRFSSYQSRVQDCGTCFPLPLCLQMSYAAAGALAIVYIQFLYYQTTTHSHLFTGRKYV